MWEMFQSMLIDGLTPNQFLLLHATKNKLSLPILKPKTEMAYLFDTGFITGDNQLTQKSIALIAKYESYFIKAKKKTSTELLGKEFASKLAEYRNIFPAGKIPSGKPARVNVKTLENSFRWFFENYDFSWDEVISATKRYVNEYQNNNYLYMKTSQYFIGKEDKNKVKTSELADYCDMIRDGVVDDTNNHFKERVV